MTVELISVGTEILLGNIVNTNAAYLSEKCALLGLSCFHQSVVGDNEERMEEAIRLAVSRSDIVILGGGLGPTKDDLTKEVTARVFGRAVYEDSYVKECMSADQRIKLVISDESPLLAPPPRTLPIKSTNHTSAARRASRTAIQHARNQFLLIFASLILVCLSIP